MWFVWVLCRGFCWRLVYCLDEVVGRGILQYDGADMH